MAKFKVGDVVIGNKDANSHYGITKEGWIGKVVWASKITGLMTVSKGNKIYTVHCDFFDIYKQKPETIVIYRKGAEVIAVDKQNGKTAKAKCSPEDTFDFATGAKIAFERLIGGDKKPEQKKYYNGKVVCVKSGYSWWTVGKVYEVKGGIITADDGDKYPKIGERYTDAEDVRHAGCSEGTRHNMENEFIELKE